MAVYKVIQDIEAEDKFIGPLTLKQFIFACITAVSIYLCFVFIVKQIWFMAIPFFPVIFTGGFLAFPWGRDQPTEVWLLAKLRFFIKPRKRIWDQSGVQELVTITAPKHDEIQYTNNLSLGEVRSRLKILADTIDSRGWAIKNVNVNLYNQSANAFANQFSDRLIDLSSIPQEVPATEVLASDDIMDPQNNPLAQHLDEMINNASDNHRQAIMQQMEDARVQTNTSPQPAVGAPAPNYWFINQPDNTTVPTGVSQFSSAPNSPTASPATDNKQLDAEAKALLERIHKEQSQPAAPIYGHMKVIQPLSEVGQQTKVESGESKNNKQPVETSETVVTAPPVEPVSHPTSHIPNPISPAVTPPPNPAILELATNNDRDIASLAREANEVVIKLR